MEALTHSEVIEIVEVEGKRNKAKKIKDKVSKETKRQTLLANFKGKQNIFPPGVSGNPGGRPKRDLAQEIARAVFERDPVGLAKAFDAGLRKGNSGMARMFQVLSDRGYGKLTEHLQIDATVAAGVAERLQRARQRVKALPTSEDKQVGGRVERTEE